LPHVKNAAIDYIVQNSEDVFSSRSYRLFTESNSLMSEVMLALYTKLSGKKRKCYFKDLDWSSIVLVCILFVSYNETKHDGPWW
jgi:hypothetical protein